MVPAVNKYFYNSLVMHSNSGVTR